MTIRIHTRVTNTVCRLQRFGMCDTPRPSADLSVAVGTAAGACSSPQSHARFLRHLTERPAHHDRHAARRRARRATAARRARRTSMRSRPRRPLLVRARAGRRDAPLAREHPDRPLPVSARLPREQRLPADARHPDAGDAAEGGGLRTGAFVAAFPLDARFGLTPGFDVYDGRFDECGSGASSLLPERPAPVVVARAMTWIRSAERPLVRVGARLRSARAVPAAAAFRSRVRRAAVLRRSGRGRPALGPLLAVANRSPRSTLVVLTGDHGEVARRARRDDARPVRVRIDAARAVLMARVGARTAGGADRAGGSGGPGGFVRTSRRGTSTSCRRFSTCSRCRSGRSAGPLAAHGCGPSDAADRASYFEAMSSMLDFGFAPLDGVLVGREKYIRLPMPELYDLAGAIRRTSQSGRSPDAAVERRALAARLAEFAAERAGRAAPEDPEVAARLRSLGYVSRIGRAESALHGADDPKRLVDIDRLMHEAVALGEDGQLPEAIERYKRVLAARPGLTAAARHLAFAYWRLGDAPNAIATLTARGGLPPRTSASKCSSRPISAESVGRPSRSRCSKRRPAAGTELDALNALGIAYASSGRTADALEAFTRSLQLDPGTRRPTRTSARFSSTRAGSTRRTPNLRAPSSSIRDRRRRTTAWR